MDELAFPLYVRRLALELALTGWVLNDGAGVVADVQGSGDAVEAFCGRVRLEAPAGARIERVGWAPLDPRPVAGFTVAGLDDAPDPAGDGGTARTARRRPPTPRGRSLLDLRWPTSRPATPASPSSPPRPTAGSGTRSCRARRAARGSRWRPACRSTGPARSMARFDRCDACRRDDEDPSGRRFRSATTACHACGPAPELLEAVPGPAGGQHALDAVRSAAVAPRGRARPRPRDPRRRGIVAVKGVGGYHLACDRHQRRGGAAAARPQAGRRPAVRRPRPDLATAREVADVDELEAGLLTSGRRPVVPCAGPGGRRSRWPPRWRRATAGWGAPPPSAVQCCSRPAGDRSGPAGAGADQRQPAPASRSSRDDEEALRRLSGVADAGLRHDREIHVALRRLCPRGRRRRASPLRRSRGRRRCRSSCRCRGGDRRRGRGPRGRLLHLRRAGSAAVGARRRHGRHRDPARLRRGSIDLQSLVDVDPRRLVVDTHPLLPQRPGRRGRRRRAGHDPARVQHHHAHIASCSRRTDTRAPAACCGVALDGGGHGDDGAVGAARCCCLTTPGMSGSRTGHVPLAGGTPPSAGPTGWRSAHLHAAGVPRRRPAVRRRSRPSGSGRCWPHQPQTGLACVPTSSMGRRSTPSRRSPASVTSAWRTRRRRRGAAGAGGGRARRGSEGAYPLRSSRRPAAARCSGTAGRWCGRSRTSRPRRGARRGGRRPVPPRGGGRGGPGSPCTPGACARCDGRPER